jgi:hypothetical protein
MWGACEMTTRPPDVLGAPFSSGTLSALSAIVVATASGLEPDPDVPSSPTIARCAAIGRIERNPTIATTTTPPSNSLRMFSSCFDLLYV